jgi:hypothetical protein
MIEAMGAEGDGVRGVTLILTRGLIEGAMGIGALDDRWVVMTGAFSFVPDAGSAAACDRSDGEGVGDGEWCGEDVGDADGVLAVVVAADAVAKRVGATGCVAVLWAACDELRPTASAVGRSPADDTQASRYDYVSPTTRLLHRSPGWLSATDAIPSCVDERLR